MACRGVLFAIAEHDAQRLKTAQGNDDAVRNIIQEEIEAAWDEEHLCATDKAWDAIERCLAGTARGDGPLSMCMLGGEQLHRGDNYIVSLLTPEQVRQVAEAMKPIDREWLRLQYSKIDPADYGAPGSLNQQDFEYTWDYFQSVRSFYLKAAAENRWSIFTVDQ